MSLEMSSTPSPTMSAALQAASEALFVHHADHVPGGFSPTALPNVAFFRTDAPAPRVPLRYPPGIAIILAGRKVGHLNGSRFEYGVGQYLVIGLPLIFECETFASPEAPLFGLFLSFEATELRALAEVLVDEPRADAGKAALPAGSGLGVEPRDLTPPMMEARTRLLTQLCDPQDAQALGPGTLREVFYHALQDGHGRVLLSLTQQSRPEARIADLLRDLPPAADGAIPRVADLARAAGMSQASLFRHFKQVTGMPPLQYFKRQRLMQARDLLGQARHSVAQTAHEVGYSSAAQFSRDYTAFFGHPPSQDRAAAKQQTSAQTEI